MRIRVGIAVLALFAFGYGGSAAGASVADVVQRDLAPAEGVVVAAEDGEIILDLNAADGLATGDLVAVLGEGRKLTHPKTGEILGALETTRAVLRVFRVRDGFSHARRIGESQGPIRRGDPVRRFAEMPVRFWDYAGDGETLFRQLRDALPTLKWGDYAGDQADRPAEPAAPEGWNGLVFVRKAGRLEIRGPEFRPLFAYRLTRETAEPAPAARTPPPAEAEIAPAPTPARPVPRTPAAPERVRTVAPEFGSMDTLGRLPGGAVTMADFLPLGDRLLLLAGAGATLRVLEAGESLRELAAADHPGGGAIYAVQWWLPEGSDTPYAAITTYGEETMDSAVYAFEEGGLRQIRGFIRGILGAMDRNGDGRPETLLRQSFDRDTFWGVRVRELFLDGDALSDREPPADFPRKFPVVGSATADLTGDGKPELAALRGQTLTIYADGEPVFESPGMGGSLSRLIYAVNPGQQDVLTSGETLEIDPAIADLDGDGLPELIAPASARSTLTVAGIYSGFKSTQLAVVSYRNGNFVKGTLGEELDHPVQGLAVFRGRVYMVVSKPGNLLGKGGESRLLRFRLAE